MSGLANVFPQQKQELTMAMTLRRGDRGPEVQRLQELLNTRLKPIPRLRPDGDFGALTEAVVREYQVSVGLGIDGIVGPRTWAALEKGLVTPMPAAIPGHYPDAPWMAVAGKEIGQKAVAGRAYNPRILDYHATTTLRAQSDETAWCSAFVNWCLRQAGITGTNSAGAASWLTWKGGQPVGPRPGAITVIHNPRMVNTRLSRSGNHVGFLLQDTGSHYKLLGGNQKAMVKTSSFPKSSWHLKGYRWPKQ
ncbi:uncharacterized protein sS8_2932 [Methylocaldum marinum]|uniref:Peptidoglycan binding-like domain-containing protein n=1 Tax=Methylocaldum marinum TaxID=1432792 RepID=A0A250KTL2_9GAMM|nr:TIGR02594 family protein [Methylocaldum marinum]BBA34876.1 uncharacterized protein sS8_2932 [Methylocaldum marinum]